METVVVLNGYLRDCCPSMVSNHLGLQPLTPDTTGHFSPLNCCSERHFLLLSENPRDVYTSVKIPAVHRLHVQTHLNLLFFSVLMFAL